MFRGAVPVYMLAAWGSEAIVNPTLATTLVIGHMLVRWWLRFLTS